MYQLVVIAIDGFITQEWLDHYVWQGVDKVLMVGEGPNVEHVEYISDLSQVDARWLFMARQDEYLFGLTDKLGNLIVGYDCSIRVPCLLFGTPYQDDPPGIREYLTHPITLDHPRTILMSGSVQTCDASNLRLHRYPLISINNFDGSIDLFYQCNRLTIEDTTLRDLVKYDYLPPVRHKHYLCVVATAKNEATILDEWIQHYLWQGVDRIFLIDNGSTDDTKERASRYPQVTYYYKPKPHSQDDHSRQIYPDIDTTWLAILDLDEYMYGTEAKLSDTLRQYEDYDCVSVPWSEFGSKLKDNPKSLRLELIDRVSIDDGCNIKSVYKKDKVPSWWIYHHYPVNRDYLHCVTETDKIRLNHYRLVSEWYFQNVKATRGDAVSEAFDNNYRTMDYFHSRNASIYGQDTQLRDLVLEANQ